MSEKKVERVAVVGAGAMGAGIGLEFARFGYMVALMSRHETTLQNTMQNAREALDLMVETEFISADVAQAALGRMRTTTDMADAVSGADHVVEAVPEDLTLKQELFARLDEICPAYVSLATNSTSFRAEDCAAQVKHHPERILITHYWLPAHLMPLVEVIGGKRTDPVVRERVADLLRGMRKKVVVQELEQQTGPAGWGNSLQGSLGGQARKLVDEGCDFRVVDDLIRFGFGRRLYYLGRYIHTDVLGLDFGYNSAKKRGAEPWGPIKERVERGELGLKSGKGFYDWPGDTGKQFMRYYHSGLIRLLKMDMERGDI